MVRGRPVWSGASGRAGSSDAVFSLATVTRSFIAALTLRRIDEGRLSLDQTVSHVLGGAVSKDVGRSTVGQLLASTSGSATTVTTRPCGLR